MSSDIVLGFQPKYLREVSPKISGQAEFAVVLKINKMTTIQVKQIRNFLARIGMFVQPINKNTITSFIHGFEFGTNRDFTKQLSQYIENEKGIKCLSLGWWSQIERLATQNQSNWVDTFKEVSYELLEKLFPLRGYIVVEPDFTEELFKNYTHDTVVKCLEYIRINTNKIFPTLVEFCEFDLISNITPHNQGKAYPSFGIHCKENNRFEEIPHVFDLAEKIDLFVNQITLEKVIELSEDFNYVDWKKLEKLEVFPER